MSAAVWLAASPLPPERCRAVSTGAGAPALRFGALTVLALGWLLPAHPRFGAQPGGAQPGGAQPILAHAARLVASRERRAAGRLLERASRERERAAEAYDIMP